MKRKSRYFIIACLFVLLGVSCNRQENNTGTDFEIRNFIPITNWDVPDSGNMAKKIINLDYHNAINGFVIPSMRQTDDGFFYGEFYVRNLTEKTRKFFFNVYYQNESYKFPECVDNRSKQHPYANENFYGSRCVDSLAFAETPLIPADGKFHRVQFRMRITGNPRNENRYITGGENQRWMRNPRVGAYSFLLVMTTKENIDRRVIPDYVANISLMKDSAFINPYFYFLFGDGKNLANVKITFSGNYLKVKAKPDIAAGIYIKPGDYNPEQLLHDTTKNCGSNSYLYNNAPFKPFVSFVDTSVRISNIPVLADVVNENYSLRDFNWNRTFYKKEEMITTKPGNTDCPCSQYGVDSAKSQVSIRNKAAHYGDWHKYSTGIKTRHGFTYGKYTVKVKMTELLNKFGVWNGITNSVWLVSQMDEPWNNCRRCNKEGYLSKYWGKGKNERSEFTGYSEIDFEILKTVNYCPSYQFPPAYYYPVANRNKTSYWDVPLPLALQRDSANIMVCCTNWDMACPDPEKYDVGCKPISYGNQTFLAHRWDYWYRNLSIRTPEPDNELFGSEYYYFQIEWKPDEIIWRIGPQKNKLRVVAYMNSSVTNIPNNQMILVISQEFHDTAWWHGSPFEQGFIPFPKNDLVGKIFEIEIE